MKQQPPLIPMPDYIRAFRVIHSILSGVDASMTKACLFFSLAGVEILKRHYKKIAIPVAGSAFYRVHDETESVLAFNQMEGDSISSSMDAFHSWIICEGMVVDFMAPLFREASREAGLKPLVARKMFQRNMGSMSPSINALSHEGDFYCESNMELTDSLMKGLTEKPMCGDLAEMCVHWFVKPPRKIKPSTTMTDDLGKLFNMSLCDISVTGAW